MHSSHSQRPTLPVAPDLQVRKQIDEVGLSFAQFKALRVLDLSGNRLRFPRQLDAVLAAPVLESLDLRGNPIVRELSDFRLHILAHCASLAVRELNGEPVDAEERCRSWLAFPDRDPFLHASARDALAGPLDDEIAAAYKRAAVGVADDRIAAQEAAAAAQRAADEAAAAKMAELAANRAALDAERAAEAERIAAEREREQQLLRQAHAAQRQVAIEAGLVGQHIAIANR